MEKKVENVLDFAENFVRIDFAKLSVLPKENTCHRGVNTLTNSLKI